MDVGNPGDFHRVLKGQEYAFPRPYFRRHIQEVLTVEGYLPFGDPIVIPSGEYGGEGAFAGTIGSHDGVHFPGIYPKVDTLQNLLLLYFSM